jgi:beta-lactamase class A
VVRALFADFVREQPGRWSLCYARLPDGETVSCATDEEPMVSASLVKLFILGAVCQRIEQGELRWEDAETRLRAMITVSDNASANELIRLLGGGDAEAGMAAVNAWCADLAYADTRLNRLMLADNGLQNYTGAADCAAFLTAVYRGECVSPEASRRMLALLREQTVNDRLPALLPAGTAVAHKTGDLSGLCCADVGIVFSPGGDYLLCVICNDQPYDAAAREAIAALSAQVYALVNP